MDVKELLLFEIEDPKYLFELNTKTIQSPLRNFPPIFFVLQKNRNPVMFNVLNCGEKDRRIHYSIIRKQSHVGNIDNCAFIKFRQKTSTIDWRCTEKITDEELDSLYLPVIMIDENSNVWKILNRTIKQDTSKKPIISNVIFFDNLSYMTTYIDSIKPCCKIIYRHTVFSRTIFFSLNKTNNSNSWEILLTLQEDVETKRTGDILVINSKKTPIDNQLKDLIGASK